MYDVQDERGVPLSTGIPSIVVWTGVAGVALIFVVAGMVLANSGFGHIWPASDTLTVKL